MSSLPPPAPPGGKDNDNVTAQHGPEEEGDSNSNNNSAMTKRSLSKDDAGVGDDRPHKRPARSSSEIPTTGTGGPNAIPLPTFANLPKQNPTCMTTTNKSGNDGTASSPPPPLNEQQVHHQQQDRQQQQEEEPQQDAADTATLASSITYYVLRDGGEPENGKVSTTTTTDAAMLGQEEEEQQQQPPEAAAATTTAARVLPANTVVRMRIDGQTLDLRVGDVVLLSGGEDSCSEDDISLADENAPPPTLPATGAATTGATSEAASKHNLLWTARIEGFTGTGGQREPGTGLDNHVHENDEISFSARWFLTPKDIESLPAGIPWVGPVSREALCSQKEGTNTATAAVATTELVLSSKVDDNDIACIRGRAAIKYNPTEQDLVHLEQQDDAANVSGSGIAGNNLQHDVVYYCRYHLDVSDVNFSSYRLSYYDVQLHGPGTAVTIPSAGGVAMDTFMLEAQEQQKQQQAQGKQQQQQQRGDNGDGDDDDDDDDDSSDSDNDDSTDGGERRVVVEGEGSQLRESIAVGIMHQAVVGPFIPGQLRARSRNPTLVWKASRHYHSKDNNNNAAAAAAAADNENNSNKEEEEKATLKFEDFLQRVAKVHTPFLTKHRLTTTDPYSPLPAHKAEALQRRRKQPILTGSFLSTASMLNVNSKNSKKNNKCTSSSITTTIAPAALKDDKSNDGVVVKEQGGEGEATESAASPTAATENDVAPTATVKDTAATAEKFTASVDGEKDAEMGDGAKPKSASAAQEQPVVDMEIDDTTAETKKVDGVVDGAVDDKVEPMSLDETEDDDKKVAAKKDDDDVVDKVQDEKMQEEKEDKDDKIVVDDSKKKEDEASDGGPVLECDLRKECVAEAILELWTASGENVDAAMEAVEKDLKSGEGRFTTGWTTDEKKIFDDGFRETQGELRLIAKRLAPRKTLKDVVDYHYRFKIPDQFRKYQDKKRELALRMMDCIEKRRFHDPTAGADDLNGGGGTFSRRGSVTGGGDKQQGWEDTTAVDVTGATEERRQKARDLLLDVQSKLGNEIMAEVMNAVRKLNRSYDGETRNSLFHLLRGHQELQKRFSEFLPRHF